MITENQGSAQAELPRYKCHKEVWALKIAKIERVKPTIEELDKILNSSDDEVKTLPITAAIITPLDTRYASLTVDDNYMRKHKPQVGGYYVVYKDGYKSFSPASAFEEGYTLVK